MLCTCVPVLCNQWVCYAYHTACHAFVLCIHQLIEDCRGGSHRSRNTLVCLCSQPVRLQLRGSCSAWACLPVLCIQWACLPVLCNQCVCNCVAHAQLGLVYLCCASSALFTRLTAYHAPVRLPCTPGVVLMRLAQGMSCAPNVQQVRVSVCLYADT